MDNVTRLLMQGAAGAAGGKTYVDDVFSTYLYDGTGDTKTITNGIDLSGEGGMVWCKRRDISGWHQLLDTSRGVGKTVYSNSNYAEVYESTSITAFNNNGWTMGSHGGINANTYDYASWTFRKAPGFFDIVTYTGNSQANRVVTHNLGSVPGCIMIKRLTGSIEDWRVYHRGTDPENPGDYYLRLNQDHARNDADTFMDTIPTSTQFLLNSYSDVNASGETYVAYIFAGGESTADTARSLTFDGSYDSLQLASSSDFNFGTGDFTFEGWLKPNNNTNFQVFLNWGSDNPSIGISNDSNSYIYYNSTVNTKIAGIAAVGEWTHYAISRSSGTTRLFLNGDLKNSFSDSHNYGAQALSIGAYINGNNSWNGSISNVRIVKGTAVYTSSFKPPTEPLTNITNTKLLCCNNSSTTGSTVTPGTITAENNVTASTDSPFDDPEGFQFGKDGDQNIIKCGSFLGNGSATGPEVNLGWEPQWVLTKNVGISDEWYIFDSMRGIVTGGYDPRLRPNSSGAESTGDPRLELTPRGFKITSDNGDINGNGNRIIYMALRRQDGLVGKPAEAGTDVFAMDTGNSNADQAFTSGFPVDWAFYKKPDTGYNWYPHSRLTGQKYMYFDSNAAEQTNAWAVWDDNTGWAENTHYDSAFQSWMWKRGAGFDVVTYAGNSSGGRQIAHNLGRVPEMMWVKSRTGSSDWRVYHSGVVGGYDGTNTWNTDSNAAKYQLYLNSAYYAVNNTSSFNQTQPTSTHFTVGTSSGVNTSGNSYINLLFSSVSGISKVGSYTGSSSALTITTGFQPRFVIIKNIRNQGNNWTTGWFTFDTTRGWAAGNNDKRMRLNDNAAQTTEDWTNPISTGFTIDSGNHLNNNGEEYIYYAHA